MKRYDDYHQQVPATKPHDGFFFEPVSHGDRAGERVQRPVPDSPFLHRPSQAFSQPYKDVK